MSNRTLLYMLGLALAAILGLFLIKLIPIAEHHQLEKYIFKGDVQNTEIVHLGLPYTLNFEQQNTLLDALNQSIPVGMEPFKLNPNLPYKKIIIYRFNATPLELIPIDFDGKDLIFSAPAWNSNGYMRDVSTGRLKDMLEKAYDS